MGIKQLWELLEPAKEESLLAEFRGKSIAVDFSTWLVECKESPFSSRSIFFRLLDCMNNGVTLVFVFDSLEAPSVKDRKRGYDFFNLCLKWKHLLNMMGFCTIQANGEAEKTCANLNLLQKVDACMTSDGDVFAYGASTVLKGYKANSNRQSKVDEYKLAHIQEKLKARFGQKEFIAAALLIGCDYCHGVENVGKAKFLKLLKELEGKHLTGSESDFNIIERMRLWRDSLCVTSDQEINPLKLDPISSQTELKVIAALKADDLDEKIISEFLDKDNTDLDGLQMSMKTPKIGEVFKLLKESPFGISTEVSKKLFHSLVIMAFHNGVPDLQITPEKVLKEVKRKQFYLVKFKKLDIDDLNEEGYEIIVPQTEFNKRYPSMIPDLDKETSTKSKGKGGKRTSQNDTTQKKITDMFVIAKKRKETSK